MNTYSYRVTNLIRDDQGIVVTAVVDVTVSDGESSYTHIFNVGLHPPSETLIPYEDLTEETVIGWVKALCQKDIEAHADAELAASKIRVAPRYGVPWA